MYTLKFYRNDYATNIKSLTLSLLLLKKIMIRGDPYSMPNINERLVDK